MSYLNDSTGPADCQGRSRCEGKTGLQEPATTISLPRLLLFRYLHFFVFFFSILQPFLKASKELFRVIQADRKAGKPARDTA